MNLTRDRVHSIGWMTVLLVCGALSLALMLRVNAVRSEVASAERRIVYLKRDIDFLQTEFETRSNQQQLKNLNDVEFGYEAPRANQYIEGERQLAALGKAPAPGAPVPIRYATAENDVSDSDASSAGGAELLAMVSPVVKTGSTSAKAKTPSEDGKPESKVLASDSRNLGKRLARIEVASDAQ